MKSVVTQDPCCLGPEVAGLCTPDKVWAVIPDIEGRQDQRQATMLFEAGASSASVVLLDRSTALSMFETLSADLTQRIPDIENMIASALVALWRLPGDRALLLAADLDGGFARADLENILARSRIDPLTRPRFDAKTLSRDPGLSEGMRSALSRLSS